VAGDQHLIDVPDAEDPWPLVFEVAAATPEGSWVLVGGLMVHAHAMRAGITPSRPTRDVDLLLDIGASTVSDVTGPLQKLGFRPLEGAGPVHRFVRGDDIIDVMVEQGVSARWTRKPVFAAPAARQAINRQDRYTLKRSSSSVRIGIPDALGAIVAKAAAYRVDQRDRERHLEDIAVLLASAGGVGKLALDRLTKKDKQHLRPAFNELSDDGHEAWFVLEADDQVVGQRARDAISANIAP
jgi:hypothetical protein